MRPRAWWVVAAAALATASTRALVVLSAPQVLATADEATWKHGVVASQLAQGQAVTLDWLRRLAVHPFNYHQPALVPYNLAYAAFAGVFGTGFVQLHLFCAISAVLGAAAWTWLMVRAGSRLAGLLAGLGFALMPLPAALMSVRPWSGHVEAQALAALALALAWSDLRRRHLLVGLVAGAALSLSALALPLLASAALGLALARRGARDGDPAASPVRAWPAGGLGLVIGLAPVWARALSGPPFSEVPVLEDPASLPGAILRGDFGVSLAEALWPPFHLVVHARNVTAAHAWQGLPAGDDLPANLGAVVASVAALVVGLRRTDPGQRALGITLALTPWATLFMVGLAGPDLALRYLYGIYPVAVAAMAWLGGTVPRSGAALLLLAWVLPGGRDLARTIAPARWPLALGYAPDTWMIPFQLDATPPLERWPDTLTFLERRAASDCCRSAMGFGDAFRPLDTRSAAGWQLPPEPGPDLVSRAVGLASTQEAQGVELGLELALVWRNLGWALALCADWDPERLAGWLRASATNLTPEQVRWLEDGAGEGAAASGHPGSSWNMLTESSL